MSEDKALPKGLRDEEVEKGKIKRPLVPYIPPVDPILDTVEGKLGTKNFKVSLPDGTIVYHAVYDNGLNKTFMIHMQEVMNFCKRKGFYKSYKKAKTNFKDCTSRFLWPNKNSTMPTLNLGLNFGILKLNNISSILEKNVIQWYLPTRTSGIFLQEPMVSSIKKPMTGFTS
jgi:hypothetical protein